MSVRSISIYPANFATFKESWIFGCPKRPFRTPVAPKRDVMWYEILPPSLFSAHYASLILRWLLLRGRGGLHILSCDQAWTFSSNCTCKIHNTLRTTFRAAVHSNRWRKAIRFIQSTQLSIELVFANGCGIKSAARSICSLDCAAQTRYDVIWKFTPIIFLAHCASFMSR